MQKREKLVTCHSRLLSFSELGITKTEKNALTHLEPNKRSHSLITVVLCLLFMLKSINTLHSIQ